MRNWVSAALWLVLIVLHITTSLIEPDWDCLMRAVDPGGPIWLVYVAKSDIHLHALLLFSPLVLMPLGLGLCEDSSAHQVPWIEIVAASLLGLSLLVRPVDPRVMMATEPELRRIVPLGFLCSMPWLLVRGRDAVAVLVGWIRGGVPGHAGLCMQSARIFPAIGAAWLVANRSGWTPWGFDPLIVLLTAAHFHHAGFTLPLMAGLNAKASPGCWTRFSCVAILAGVPLVAAGITCTHFGVLRFLEPFGVTVLVLGALGVAVSQIRRGMSKQGGWLERAGFVVSGISLLSAMVLAMGFGLRHVVPNLALTMPQMWMIHGTLNAFGFGLCGILAWRSRMAAI